MDVLDAVVQGIGLAGTKYYGDKGLSTSEQSFEEENDLSKRAQLMEAFLELEGQFVLLDSDLVTSSKEAERDSYDHHNQELQMIILSCTLMFAAMSTIIVQGKIPSTTEAVKILYSVSNALAFSCLLWSIVICIEILHVASKFMISKANSNAISIRNARQNTEKFFNCIREKKFPEDSTNGNAESREETKDEQATRTNTGINGRSSNRGFESSPRQSGKLISNYVGIADAETFPGNSISRLWELIEHNTINMLIKRRELVETFISPITFDTFWSRECRRYFSAAVSLFYIGTTLMLLSTIIFLYLQFAVGFQNKVAAIVGTVFISLSIFQSLRIRNTIQRKKRYARMATQNLSIGTEIEVCRSDSCCCCPYWERAKLLSEYNQLPGEAGLIKVEYIGTTGESQDRRETDVISFTQIRMPEYDVVSSQQYSYILGGDDMNDVEAAKDN